jgi:hypothetical protein
MRTLSFRGQQELAKIDSRSIRIRGKVREDMAR